MRFNLETPKGTSGLELPCREQDLAVFCANTDIPNTASTSVTVERVHFNNRADALFGGKAMNLDKLNYLAKRMDSLSGKELDTFYAVAHGERLDNLSDLINLTFNTHCASVVRDFSDLDKVGKELYLTAEGAVSPRVFEELNGAKYLASVMAENPHPTLQSPWQSDGDEWEHQPWKERSQPVLADDGATTDDGG